MLMKLKPEGTLREAQRQKSALKAHRALGKGRSWWPEAVPSTAGRRTVCSSREESLGSGVFASSWLWLVAVGCAFSRQT